MPLDVVLATPLLGLGGTAKALVTHAIAHDRSRVVPRVVATMGPDVRDAELRAAGIAVDSVDGDRARLAELLRGADVVHVHRGGFAEPLVPAACRDAGVRHLVETNVFGFVDSSPDEAQFDCHLFISQMCAMRYRDEVGAEPAGFFDRHRVSYYPLDVDALAAAAPGRREARALLGLDPERPVVGRVGRDDDRKWSPIVIDALPHLLRRVPDAQVLLVGVTPTLRRRLDRHGLTARVHVEEPTADPARLAAFYAACDVFASASVIGESFGLAIAEALALGVPVVTSSTPWTDNAQVEVVEPGVTGYVANHPRAFGEAIAALLTDDERRARFGAAAAASVRERFGVGPLTRQLEDLYEALVRDGRPPRAWRPGAAELDAFVADYPRRAAAEFRPLRPVERVQARAAVLRGRAGWAVRDLAASPRQVLTRLGVRRSA